MSRRQHYQGTLTELKRQATEALSRYEPNHEMAFGYLVSACISPDIAYTNIQLRAIAEALTKALKVNA